MTTSATPSTERPGLSSLPLLSPSLWRRVVFLISKPDFFHPASTNSNVMVLRGHEITLEWIPKGLPTPKVEWRKKDGVLEKTTGQVANFDRWLRFSITQDDDGEYECKASATRSFTVAVEVAPYWVKKPQSRIYSPGETVELDCQAEGTLKPNITWRINGVLITGTPSLRTFLSPNLLVPSSNVTLVSSITSVSLSWMLGEPYGHDGFPILYLSGSGKWEQSEEVTSAFYTLTGLQPGTVYHLRMTHRSKTVWEGEAKTAEADSMYALHNKLADPNHLHQHHHHHAGSDTDYHQTAPGQQMQRASTNRNFRFST